LGLITLTLLFASLSFVLSGDGLVIGLNGRLVAEMVLLGANLVDGCPFLQR
jgi:hypothetical protein